MKLSELKPCIGCGGPLIDSAGHVRTWYVVTISSAMLNPQATRETAGLMQMFAGNIILAETMGSSGDDAVVVCGEKFPELQHRLMVCMKCALEKPLGALMEAEIRNRLKEAHG